MARSLPGVHVPHRKNTAHKPVSRMPAPQAVTIPMSMHIGAPAVPVVKVGDSVRVGTKIADGCGAVSAPIYSSVSGTVKKISEFVLHNGSTTPAVVIESDGEMTPDESIVPPAVDSRESLIRAVRDSGVVGLGGAGFPTHVKLNVEADRVEHLIINGAECEPYITSDTYTMTERTDDMARALEALIRFFELKSVIIGIESNKKQAIESTRRMAEQLSGDCSVSVKVLPSKDPQGGEKVLVYQTVGKIVPAGKLPIDVGCVVLNCTTLACIGTYLATGMPLVEKCVTVDGGAVKNPQNVIVPIGTSLSDLFEFCGGLTTQPAKIIYGGPMMGLTVPDLNAPVLKNTNAILALTKKEAALPKTSPCIRCGSCTNVCPFGLQPAAIAKAFETKNTEALEALNVTACMECGCCSFICPANRPLVQSNKLSKALLKEQQAKEAKQA